MTPPSPFSPPAAGAPSALCLLCGASNPSSATSCQTCGSPLAPAAPLYSDEGDFSGFARALPAHTSLRNGDYRILGVLGQGGFGITYRASNQRLEREVAIKEFFPATCERVGRSVSASGGLSSSDFDSLRAAFMEEARILARFELPAVVRVMGAWEENASAYMEMEILRGPTMAQVLEERERLPVEATLRLFEPVLDALEAIHSAGWLHRDIKPHNIIFEPLGAGPTDPRGLDLASCRAVLLDFGAAKKVAANVSQSFSVIVTPGYAPLEQYATRAKRGSFTDVYALCATLYHALSGQAPPPASDRALHDDLIPLRELRPEVPHAVARAIEEGLRSAIAMRPQTMGDLRDLLRGRGSLQAVVDVADFEPRDPYKNPKSDQLKSRQQSILSNIQAINDPKTAQQKLIESLPLSEQAMQAQRMAQFMGDAAPPLPTARPTHGAHSTVDIERGGHRRAPDHLHNTEEEQKWGAHFYMTAIGIGIFILLLGSLLFGHSGPPAPYVSAPPVEVQELEPLEPGVAAPAKAAKPLLENVQLSPDRRYRFATTSDGHGRVWDVAANRRILDMGFIASTDLHTGRWSPDSKYLLIVQGALENENSDVTKHDVRLFRMASPQLLWRRSIVGQSPDLAPEWRMGSGTVGLNVDNKMRRFPLD